MLLLVDKRIRKAIWNQMNQIANHDHNNRNLIIEPILLRSIKGELIYYLMDKLHRSRQVGCLKEDPTEYYKMKCQQSVDKIAHKSRQDFEFSKN